MPKLLGITFEKRQIAISGSVILYILILIIGFFSDGSDTLQTWKGYSSLVVQKTANLRDIHKQLESNGISDSISSFNALISVGTFGGVREIPLSRVGQLPHDIRYTPYLNSIHNFFSDESGSYSIIYIPQREPLPTLMLKINRALSGTGYDWHVIEWNNRDRTVLLVSLAILLLWVVVFSRKYWWVTLMLTIPWSVFAIALGPRMIGVATTLLYLSILVSESVILTLKRYVHEGSPVHFFWELFHRPPQAIKALKEMIPYFRIHELGKSLMLYLTVFATFFVFLTASGDSSSIPTLIVLVCFAWPMVWVWSAYVFLNHKKRFEHALFNPVPIVKVRKTHSIYLWPVLVPLALCSVILPLLYQGQNNGLGSQKVPLPNTSKGYVSLDFESFKKSFDQLAIDNLPSLSQLVAHHALQEIIGYTRLKDQSKLYFRFPNMGEAIAVPSSKGPFGEKLVFDQTWLDSLHSNASVLNPETILWSQREGFGLAYGSSLRVYSADIWSIIGFVLLGVYGLFAIIPKRKTLEPNKRILLRGK